MEQGVMMGFYWTMQNNSSSGTSYNQPMNFQLLVVEEQRPKRDCGDCISMLVLALNTLAGHK
jgi:hypothetical protein